MSTAILGLINTAAAGGIISSNAANDLNNTIDNQLGKLTELLDPDGVISGWTITALAGNLNVAAGEGWVGGAHCKTTGVQAITGIIADSTLHYIYAERKSAVTGRVSESFTLGTVDFVANTTGVAPSANSILLATGTTDGDHSEFASVSNVPSGRAAVRIPLTGVSVVVPDTGTINTQFAITHTLGITPSGYLVIKKDKSCDVYTSTGGTAWSATTIYLKCSVDNCAITLLIF